MDTPEMHWADPKNPDNLDDRLVDHGLAPDHPWYFVVSTYSGITSQKNLIRVHTRRMLKQSAEDWRDFEESQWKKKHPRSRKKFIVIEVPHNLWSFFA